MSARSPHAPERIDVVDAMRGLAVVFMIFFHTGYGWLVPELRSGASWTLTRSLGGMAAPLFLLLAGGSLGIGWTAPGFEARARLRAGVARGLQILVLGYVLRVQMWMLDAAGYRETRAWIIAMVLGVGYTSLYVAFARWNEAKAGVLALLGLGAASVVAGAAALGRAYPDRVPGVFRVDVLQAIGASIALASLAGAALGPRRARLAAVGVLVALATPLAQAWAPDSLSGAVRGYVAQGPATPGVIPVSLFPLFPWAAYTFLGAALGLDWAVAARSGGLGARVTTMAAAGAALALASCELVPAVHHALGAHPWLTQPARVAYRTGLGLAFGGVCLVAVRVRAARWPLVTLGRNSLLVYWVHLEFAFGLAARPLAKRLDLTAWLGWALALSAAMVAIAALAAHVRPSGEIRAERRGRDGARGAIHEARGKEGAL